MPKKGGDFIRKLRKFRNFSPKKRGGGLTQPEKSLSEKSGVSKLRGGGGVSENPYKRIMWEKFPKKKGGSDPNPLLDVYLPSYFWHGTT